MRVVDEISGQIVEDYECTTILIDQLPEQLIFGYTTSKDLTTILVKNANNYNTYYIVRDACWNEKLFYSKRRGMYMSKVNMSSGEILYEEFTLGQGKFPYNFTRNYEARKSFNLFKNKQVILKPVKSSYSKYLKYSFGLEFETASGYIPENLCFLDGLIPLRDGSISGLEYSTVILKGENGISLLKQQLQTLKEYTSFNKECSLHMHFGGFPLEPEAIYRLYLLCFRLQPDIKMLTPEYTFNTAAYKKTGKDYCKPLSLYTSFEQLYECLVGTPYYGDLFQGHPNDPKREAKWRIPTRYYAVNFINLLCYAKNKTVEFRFLRPTYNFAKILLWIYIFNAILLYAETHTNLEDYNVVTLHSIINAIYPKATKLLEGIDKLRVIKYNQNNIEDFIGECTSFEDTLFPKNLIY